MDSQDEGFIVFVGKRAFYGCSKLTAVNIGSSVEDIGFDAFANCFGLTIKSLAVSPPKTSQMNAISLEVPLGTTADYLKADGWKNINKIFAVSNDIIYYPLLFEENGEHIVSVSNLFDNVKEVASNEEITIVADGIQKPNNIVLVGGHDVSETILKEGKYVFFPSPLYKENIIRSYKYPNKEIHLASSETLIENLGIDNLENAISLKINGELNGTDILTIRKMKSLKLLDLTDASIVDGGLTYYKNYATSKDKIGEYFFYEKDSLVTVLLPPSITSIGGEAFGGCISLTSVNIPNSVTSIEYKAFNRCSSLTSVTIPNSVTSIGFDAFRACTSLTSVTIPNSVTSIGEGAFGGCSSLTSVTIPNSVTSIRDGAFSGCSSLTSVDIPNSVTSICEIAFSSCSSLSSVTIPNSVTSIGRNAFSGCVKLTAVVSYNPIPPELVWQSFDDATYENAILYVPNGCRTIYWLHPYWENFKNIVELDELDDTSINDMTITPSKKTKGIYTINGIKVSDSADNIENLPKGVYIINGEIVVIK